jgi:hypothetical protein
MGDIDLGTYEHMLEYYHGMCKDLCVKWEIKWKGKESLLDRVSHFVAL